MCSLNFYWTLHHWAISHRIVLRGFAHGHWSSFDVLHNNCEWITQRCFSHYRRDTVSVVRWTNDTSDFVVSPPCCVLCAPITLAYRLSCGGAAQAATDMVPSAMMWRTTHRGAFDSCEPPTVKSPSYFNPRSVHSSKLHQHLWHLMEKKPHNLSLSIITICLPYILISPNLNKPIHSH